MKPIDLAPLLALCVIAGVQAEGNGSMDPPFAHPSPPSLSSVPPRTYIPTAPGTFIPIATRHSFADSRLPTVTDTSARVFIRTYDAEHGVYVNEEVADPACQHSNTRRDPVGAGLPAKDRAAVPVPDL
ncbi:hypothetical protein ACX3YG_12235 [Pseudomonas wadenswilerensis]